MERFANNQSMDPIFNAVNDLTDDARNDQEFRNWWSRVDSYTREVLLEPGFVLEPKCNDEGRQLRESGRTFYDDKYKSHFDRLFSSIGDWFKAMADDPLNKRFGDDIARLTRDLLFDNEGSLKFKPDLWTDIRKHILPSLVEKASSCVVVGEDHAHVLVGWICPHPAHRVHGRPVGSCHREPHVPGPQHLPECRVDGGEQLRQILAV